MVRRSWRWLLAVGLLLGLLPLATPGVVAADIEVNQCDEDTFTAALDTVQQSGGGTLTINCSEPIHFTSAKWISKHVRILGGGNGILDGSEMTSLFRVDSGATLELVGVTLRNGKSASGFGGAIRNDGTLIITDSKLHDNHATGHSDVGGAIYNDNDGTVIVTTSTFNDNSAIASIQSRSGRSGGAIHNAGGVVIVTASTFGGNRAESNSTSPDDLVDTGGAIYSGLFGTVVVTASTFGGNSASVQGGAIYNYGGTLDVTASAFSGNSAEDGGAINTFNGRLTVTASTFNGNRADLNDDQENNDGGAIAIAGNQDVRVTASTFSGNIGEFGGAINNNGRLTVTASTFSGNSAIDEGGAIRNFNTATIIASTFSDNSAPSGGAIFTYSGTTRVQGSILADSQGGNCGNDDGTFISQGHNLSDDTTCTGIPSSANIELEPLGDNGGPTQTMLPGESSAAIDANTGEACGTGDLAADQRGALRPAGEACDIGAVETDAGVPLQLIAGTLPPGPTGLPLPVVAVAAGPRDSVPSFAVDCDNDGDYETEGTSEPLNALGASASLALARCTFEEEGERSVRVRICSGDDCLAAQLSASGLNFLPRLEASVVTPTPSLEGQSVEVSVAFNDPDSTAPYTCTIDYGDGSDPEDGLVVDQETGTCTGAHTYLDDASDPVTITITVTDAGGAFDSITVTHTVENANPEIKAITLGPVRQGQPVLVTVNASDPGDDELSYTFDCEGGVVIGPQEENTAACPLDPGKASTTITVLVEDGEGGEATESVTINQSITLCADPLTGALNAPLARGGCPRGKQALELPGATSQTLCIHSYTGALRWAPRGNCGALVKHVVPDSGPLSYCEHNLTGALRYTPSGKCGKTERAGVIPGV